jgi:hypothetical protein
VFRVSFILGREKVQEEGRQSSQGSKKEALISESAICRVTVTHNSRQGRNLFLMYVAFPNRHNCIFTKNQDKGVQTKSAHSGSTGTVSVEREALSSNLSTTKKKRAQS